MHARTCARTHHALMRMRTRMSPTVSHQGLSVGILRNKKGTFDRYPQQCAICRHARQHRRRGAARRARHVRSLHWHAHARVLAFVVHLLPSSLLLSRRLCCSIGFTFRGLGLFRSFRWLMKVDTFASINIFLFTLSNGALPLMTGKMSVEVLVVQVATMYVGLTVLRMDGRSGCCAGALSPLFRRGGHGCVQGVSSKKMCGECTVRMPCHCIFVSLCGLCKCLSKDLKGENLLSGRTHWK